MIKIEARVYTKTQSCQDADNAYGEAGTKAEYDGQDDRCNQ